MLHPLPQKYKTHVQGEYYQHEVEGATSLVDYIHPERAFYIFGAEDATLGERVLSRCRDVIYVPTSGCMNLAATVNVVLYDRMAKQKIKPI